MVAIKSDYGTPYETPILEERSDYLIQVYEGAVGHVHDYVTCLLRTGASVR